MQSPHWTTEPHPSPMGPQFTFADAHVRNPQLPPVPPPPLLPPPPLAPPPPDAPPPPLPPMPQLTTRSSHPARPSWRAKMKERKAYRVVMRKALAGRIFS